MEVKEGRGVEREREISDILASSVDTTNTFSYLSCVTA